MRFQKYFKAFQLANLLTIAFLFLLAPPILAVQGSVYLQQAIALMPQGSELNEVLRDSESGNDIDRLTLRILSTDSGKTFCKATVEQYDTFKAAFFLSDEFAKSGYQQCRGHFSKNQVHRIFQKKFYIATVPGGKHFADGWTTPRNETIIYLTKDIDDQQRMVQTLIHEFAVSLDRKEQIGFFGKIDFPQLGIIEDPSACQMTQLIRSPVMKHSLTALRAFELEKRIGQELNLKLPENFSNWSNVSCVQKIKFMSSYVRQLNQSIFEAEGLVNLLMDQRSCSSSSQAAQTIDDSANALNNLTLSFKDGTTDNACEYLTRGWPFFAGTSFRGGPGPRIGGGWNQAKESASNLNPSSKFKNSPDLFKPTFSPDKPVPDINEKLEPAALQVEDFLKMLKDINEK